MVSQLDGLPGQEHLAAQLLGRNWGWILFRGILCLLFGAIALIAPGSATFAFTALFAVYALVDGVFQIIAGVRGARASTERWGTLILSGVLGVGVGVLFLAWPDVSTVAYASVATIMIGLWSLFAGLLQLIAAVRLRKVIEGEGWLALSGIVGILLGIAVLYVAMTAPAVSVVAIGWMLGIYALIAGVAQVLLAFRVKRLAN